MWCFLAFSKYSRGRSHKSQIDLISVSKMKQTKIGRKEERSKDKERQKRKKDKEHDNVLKNAYFL